MADNLAFSIPPFFEELLAYFGIPFNQLTSNSFWLLYGVVVVFSFYNIPLSPIIFHYFFYPKKSEFGVFYFMDQPSSQFLHNYPTSHKH